MLKEKWGRVRNDFVQLKEKGNLSCVVKLSFVVEPSFVVALSFVVETSFVVLTFVAVFKLYYIANGARVN